MGPLHGMYGSVETEYEVQRTIKRAELTAFLFLHGKVCGPIKVHVDNKGIIHGLPVTSAIADRSQEFPSVFLSFFLHFPFFTFIFSFIKFSVFFFSFFSPFFFFFFLFLLSPASHPGPLPPPPFPLLLSLKHRCFPNKNLNFKARFWVREERRKKKEERRKKKEKRRKKEERITRPPKQVLPQSHAQDTFVIRVRENPSL